MTDAAATTRATGAAQDEADATPAPPKKRALGKILLLVVIAVVVLGGGGGVAAFMLLGKRSHAAQGGERGDRERGDRERGDRERGGETQKRDARAAEIVALDPFVVNLLPEVEGELHYLKAAIAVELSQGQAVEKIAKLSARVRNDLILYLSNLTLEDTRTADRKERIRGDLKQALNRILGGKTVSAIYLTEFVVQ